MAKRRQSGRGHNHKGRTKEGRARYLRLEHSLMSTPAWRTLDPIARAAYLEVAALYDGRNNGELFLSVRKAAERLNVCNATAQKRLKVLEDRGFIRRRRDEGERWQERLAQCWIVTAFPMGDGQPATRDYQRWRPADKQNGVPAHSTPCAA